MALVPAEDAGAVAVYEGGHELSETLREDGRLLRMFVARGEHARAEARERATRDWLIRGSFYDNWVEEFAKRYGPKGEKAGDEKHLAIIAKDCEEALRVKQQVDKLEATIRDADGDVYKLRDALMGACKDLHSPRRFVGAGDGKPMTPEAIEALKLQRQIRLREVVVQCLEGIWKSGIGGEVLRGAMEHVRHMIARFEEREEDVCLARQGHSWSRLKELVLEIEGKMPEMGEGKNMPGPEGRGSRQLIEMALKDLDGAASSKQIIEWVRVHPEALQEYGKRVRINKQGRSVKGREFEVWEKTLQNALHRDFVKMKDDQGGPFIWRCKDAASEAAVAAPLPVADQTAASDEPAGKEAPKRSAKASTKRRKTTAAEAAASLDLVQEPTAAGAMDFQGAGDLGEPVAPS
mmetsp:Transcript_6793/g.19191  ORF Transcript_6793/g.19191 Transcript_6793/m.19191 type:complete len:406 (-) Transcript_6793:347-1564(-)